MSSDGANSTPVYKRILLKLSGEALMGDQQYGVDPKVVSRIADDIQDIQRLGVETAIVIGGGNIFRGLAASARGMDRATADYMGMLATVINGLALQDALEQAGVLTRVVTAIEMRAVAEPFIRRRAIRHLEKGRVVIFAAGTGNPYARQDRDEIPEHLVSAGAGAAAARHGRHRHLALHGQRAPDRGVRHARRRQHPEGDHGGTGRHDGRGLGRIMDFNDLKGLFAEINTRMNGAIDRVRKDMAGVRTGRASTGLLDSVHVEAYGSKMPLNQLATMSIPEPSLILVQPFDPSQMAAIERGIRLSDLGLNPATDGKVIRVPIPSLTDERRKELSRHVHKQAEEGRNAVRQVRRDANERLKKLLKEHKISEDDERKGLEQVQKATDEHVKMIDELQKKKDQELLGH